MQQPPQVYTACSGQNTDENTCIAYMYSKASGREQGGCHFKRCILQKMNGRSRCEIHMKAFRWYQLDQQRRLMVEKIILNRQTNEPDSQGYRRFINQFRNNLEIPDEFYTDRGQYEIGRDPANQNVYRTQSIINHSNMDLADIIHLKYQMITQIRELQVRINRKNERIEQLQNQLRQRAQQQQGGDQQVVGRIEALQNENRQLRMQLANVTSQLQEINANGLNVVNDEAMGRPDNPRPRLRREVPQPNNPQNRQRGVNQSQKRQRRQPKTPVQGQGNTVRRQANTAVKNTNTPLMLSRLGPVNVPEDKIPRTTRSGTQF